MFGLKLIVLPSIIFVAEIQCQALTRRMMNSFDGDIKEFPWVVAIYEEDFKVVGTGTILSEKWVLSGAAMWE
jgi:hypothetical protein